MSNQQIAVIDYGMGNLHSVASALQQAAPNAEVLITGDAQSVRNADRVLFPGVGAIRDCMAEIRRLGFDALLREQVESGKPVLGVCVGMQALMEYSEENGGVDGLALLPGQVRFFGHHLPDRDLVGVQAGSLQPRPLPPRQLKVPHMGWNQVQQREHPLWAGIAQDTRFYFVHSFYVQATHAAQVVGLCEYGQPFAAALTQDNLFAVQFHPEKSHTAGLQLLRNFMSWDGKS